MIHFAGADIPCRIVERIKTRSWLSHVIDYHGFNVGELSVVVCSDEYLLSLNKQYLNHDYFTDIITFDYSENKLISGDLLISLDRVKENAKSEGVTIQQELKRVMVHGILHLIGFKDKSKKEAKEMREMENSMLKLFHVEHYNK